MKSIVAGVLVLIGLVVAAFAVQPGDTGMDEKSVVDAAKTVVKEAGDVSAEKEEEKFVYVQMTTSLGDIFLEIDKTNAPISAANFEQYVEDEFYSGTIFHRVMSNFMIQGGGFTPDLKRKETREGIANEWKNGLAHVRGTLAMARVGGDVNSGTSQFFINVKDNLFLSDPQPDGAAYAVFGRVVRGMDVVDKIRNVRTGYKQGMKDVPVETVMIEKVVMLDADKVEELELVASDG